MSRVVLVTGGSRGIGKAVCAAFSALGDTVVVNFSKSQAEAESLVKELSAGGAASFEKADVADYAQSARMVANVIARYGRIDVLVNNAGIVRDGFLMLMSTEDWRSVIETNLTGVFHCAKAVIGHMMERRQGVIVNIASLSGITGLPGQTNYSAAKAGVIGFTKALSKEVAPFNIRVNAVAPGVIEGDLVASLPQKTKEDFLRNIPMKRFGRPEEVASVVAFLASDNAGYLTGETISVTGGLY